MKNLKELSDTELILSIHKCDKEMANLLCIDIDHYPGAIMGYGDFYIEKSILLDELKKRKTTHNWAIPIIIGLRGKVSVCLDCGLWSDEGLKICNKEKK